MIHGKIIQENAGQLNAEGIDMESVIWFLIGFWSAANIVDALLYWYVVRALGKQGLFWPISGFLLIHKIMTDKY